MWGKTGSLQQGDYGVSKLCEGQFQAAFPLQKPNFQVPAVSGDSLLLQDPGGVDRCESSRLPVFWGFVLQDETQPGFTQALGVCAHTYPATVCSNYS